MSDLAKWINDLAGDYVEPWVGEQIANAWEKDKARIEALEKAATEVVECGVDAMAYDRRQVLDALAALLQEPTK